MKPRPGSDPLQIGDLLKDIVKQAGGFIRTETSKSGGKLELCFRFLRDPPVKFPLVSLPHWFNFAYGDPRFFPRYTSPFQSVTLMRATSPSTG